MELSAWIQFLGRVTEKTRVHCVALFCRAGIDLRPGPCAAERFGLVVFDEVDDTVLNGLRAYAAGAMVLAICVSPAGLRPADAWAIPRAGARDVLVWRRLPATADQVVSRLERWDAVQALLDSPRVKGTLVGQSVAWRGVLRIVVEVAAFSQSAVLVMGESGTGKELVAALVHDLDRRKDKSALVVVDCTTIVAELSGSELFGHERGAFTGASSARDGAFAMANGGTLFLDEIGELPLPLQAQLLRAVQEHHYKRVGSNVWQHTQFRLVCATNRDLEGAVASGHFRADLYYRIADCVCRMPPLRERKEDVLPLAHHFLAQTGTGSATLSFDDPVREYLLTRDYPGNVRDLRRVVAVLRNRHAGPGPITIGDVPEEERPAAAEPLGASWLDGGFESAIRQAVELEVGLRDIGRAASETAIRLALEREHGNLHRAACRLGVTDRALQMRRASHGTSH